MLDVNEAVISAHTLSTYPDLVAKGFSARKPSRGAEWDLVASYVASSLPPAPRGQARTVFIEPRIASGFPDIVVVYWHLATAQGWSVERAKLTTPDIRLLHHLALSGPLPYEELRTVSPRHRGSALDRLLRAGLVRRSKDVWRALALQRIFAVRRLIAIEAKIAEWRAGLAQALRNTWFASESYLLLGRQTLRPTLVREAEFLGVGVLTADQQLEYASSMVRRESLPQSYASWLFNEWAWRASLRSAVALDVDIRS